MKKNRLIALMLVMLMLFQTLPVLGAEAGDVTVSPTDDSYIVSGSRLEHKNYGNAGTMLFGSAYDRTALMKFDLSSIDISAYNGALLNITFNTSSESGKIDVYTVDNCDWLENKVTYANFLGDYTFSVTADITKGSGQRLSLTLNKVLQQMKNSGNKTISIALKSSSGNISVFSSEASDKSLRPSLTLTEEVAYIKGQIDFQLPEISQAQFKSEMTKVIANGHPYMIATKDKIAKIKEYAFGKDEFLTEQYSLVKAEADKLLTTNLFNMDEQLASKAQNNTNAMLSYTHTLTLGLVYLVEGDERYAQRAYDQIEYLCSLDSWGELQLIDNVQFAWAVGFCYDWLYDWLNVEQREFLVSNLRRLHLDMASDVFKNPKKAEYKDSFYQAFFVESNHGLMDTSCTFLAAMAIADTDMDFATELMALSQKQFNTPVSKLYPDGQWYEGYSYWGYVGPYVARFMQSMKGAFGHCFGYDEVDFIKKSADFPIYLTSDFAALTTDNSHFQKSVSPNPIYYTIGALANDHNLQTLSVNQVKKFKNPDAVFVLMYDPTKNYDGEVKLNLDKHFRSVDDVTMRSSFDGSQNTFAAMHVRPDIVDVSTQNGMAHRGSISAFDALGERWISDMGRETYYSGYWGNDHFKWYRTRTESASCILIDPSQDPGQVLNTPNLDIDVLESGAGSAYSIADLTEAYSTWAKSYSRGIQLTDNRKVLVVQDEIVLKNPSEMYSLFNIYKADIELLSDGKSAILHKNNKKVYVTIDCDEEFTLGSMPAEPLPTSPLPETSKPNSLNIDFMKFYIHFDKVKSANIRVCFIPYICEEELSAVTCNEFVPMSEWTVQKEIKDIPMLEDIKVNGVSLDGFTPYNRCYDMENEISVSQVTPVYDSSKYDVKVRKEESTDVVTILVTDKSDSSNMNSYSLLIPIVPEPSFVDTSNMSVLTITKTTAPEPQAENNLTNLYDGDLSTRWSANGAGTVMMIELDKPRKLGCVAVSLADGDKRRQLFDVEVSPDGKTYTRIGRFLSCGLTLDTEYYDLKNTEAQYVRIIWNGNSSNGWNSVTELRLYGK